MVRFLVNIPIGLHQVLREHAKMQGQTLTGLIRQILWDWAEENATRMKEDTFYILKDGEFKEWQEGTEE